MQNEIFILFSPKFNLTYLPNFKKFLKSKNVQKLRKKNKKQKKQKMLTIPDNLTTKHAIHAKLHKKV